MFFNWSVLCNRFDIVGDDAAIVANRTRGTTATQQAGNTSASQAGEGDSSQGSTPTSNGGGSSIERWASDPLCLATPDGSPQEGSMGARYYGRCLCVLCLASSRSLKFQRRHVYISQRIYAFADVSEQLVCLIAPSLADHHHRAWPAPSGLVSSCATICDLRFASLRLISKTRQKHESTWSSCPPSTHMPWRAFERQVAI